MKKTVFEGVINGKKFNNVEDYNNEMMRLLKEGAQIEATSETKTESEEEIKKLPGLFVNAEGGDEYYVDTLVRDDENDQSRYDVEIKRLSNILAEIDPNDKYDLTELEHLRGLTEIDSDTCCLQLKGILKDIENTKSEIRELNEKLEDLNAELEYNKKQDRVINLYNNFYKEALKKLQKNQDGENKACVNKTQETPCNTSCKCNQDQVIYNLTEKEMEKYLDTYLNKLINIFSADK